MNIKKFKNDISISDNAKLIGDKLSDKFFYDNGEFVGVIIEKDYINFKFNFCFDMLYSETIELIDKLDKYMGYNNLQIETKFFENEDDPLMYYWFNLDGYKIDEYLKKIKIEEDSKKYNL